MIGGCNEIHFLLPPEKTDRKEMAGGCNKSHFLFAVRQNKQKGHGKRMQRDSCPFAVRKDRQKGNAWRMQRKSFPFCRQKRQTKRKWMADATKVISFLTSEKTDKKEMDGRCNKSHFLFAVRKDRQKGNGWRMQQKSFPFCRQKRQTIMTIKLSKLWKGNANTQGKCYAKRGSTYRWTKSRASINRLRINFLNL